MRVSQKGQVLVLFALALTVLLGITALVVDIGGFFHERRSLQNAMDSAALAGAADLPDSPISRNIPFFGAPTVSVTAARMAAP